MKKHKKLTGSEFIKQKNKILEKIEAFKNKINKEEYTHLYNKYLIDNSPYYIGRVYEMQHGIRPRRGFKRFVIYGLDVVTALSELVMIKAGGWWLDEKNNPAKWDTMTIHGVANPAILKESKNQKNNPIADTETYKSL